MTSVQKARTTYRKDYTPFPYSVGHMDLCFRLEEGFCLVTAKSRFTRKEGRDGEPLKLYGENLELIRFLLDGEEVSEERYGIDAEGLELHRVPKEFELEIVTRIYPDENTALEGLYRSNGIYCTQCEAEGFRKITYYPDRPDVLTTITTRIEAKRDTCPVMLSNGNPLEHGELEDGYHYRIWDDPHPKPSYLFALVAGKLARIEDEFVTRSGRVVDLHIYVEERNRSKCDHAMRCLKKAMKWDEERFGLEYDLDVFMIVAVDDFNMGAMENKGLNIFNSKYVLSTPETATDQDFLGIEGVIAHEYFHNWTGNRVTCRDWFQLSLKEGLTVFRDQEFSADMNSRPVQRIDDVRLLKNFQFREDAGPMAHPVRPDSYQEINNFYTPTVYNKGAEVIRMMHCLLGETGFRAGMDLYFQRHDGQAVTCDDFVRSMEDATGKDLEQFRLWYSQAGTPLLTVRATWNKTSGEYTLDVTQSCPDTPGQTGKRPFHMPLAVGLLGEQGDDLLEEGTCILQLTEQTQRFVFQGIEEKPVLSFLREFSAPVKVEPFQDRKELAHLAAFDTDLYNRWDAMNRFSQELILECAEALGKGEAYTTDPLYHACVAQTLSSCEEDYALFALSLHLPQENVLALEMDPVEPSVLHQAREFVRSDIAEKHRARLLEIYRSTTSSGKYTITPDAIARRSANNTVLSLLMAAASLSEEVLELAKKHYYQATNMTDRIGALTALTHHEIPLRSEIFNDFAAHWEKDPLVMDKWFMLQAISSSASTLDRVHELMDHPAFSITNPNKVRALIGGFCATNQYRFHDPEGKGYRFLVERILQLDQLNPQIAARMVSPFTSWKRFEPKRRELMRRGLEQILSSENLSRDVYEIVEKSLNQ